MRYATALEALFGWLYLKGRYERINRLFEVICQGFDAKSAKRTAEAVLFLFAVIENGKWRIDQMVFILHFCILRVFFR